MNPWLWSFAAVGVLVFGAGIGNLFRLTWNEARREKAATPVKGWRL